MNCIILFILLFNTYCAQAPNGRSETDGVRGFTDDWNI